MKTMRRIRRHKGDIALLILAAVTTVLLLKTSEDPLIPQLQHSEVGEWLTQLPFGNQILFNLSTGIVTAIFTYFLFVRLPEVRKKRRIISYLSRTLKETKLNLIATYLSMVGGGSYPSGLPEELLVQGTFRSYFSDDIAPRTNRWHSVANGLNEYWLKVISAELEILHNELQFALAAIEPSYIDDYYMLKSVAAWTIRSREIDLSSDDLKPFLRGLWELHTGFNFINGYTDKDVIANGIASI